MPNEKDGNTIVEPGNGITVIPDNHPGLETTSTPKDDERTNIVKEREEMSRSIFGLKSETESDDGKLPDKEETGNPDDDKSKGTGGKDGDEKLFAGKFKTVEDLEKSYTEMTNLSMSTYNKNLALEKKIEEFIANGGKKSESKAPENADNDKKREKAIERMKILLGDEGYEDAVALNMISPDGKSKPKDEDDPEREMMREFIIEQQNMKAEKVFLEKFPEAKEYTSEIKSFQDEFLEHSKNPDGLPPEYIQELFWYATIGKNSKKIIDAKVSHVLANSTEEEKRRLVAQNITSQSAGGSGGAGKTELPDSEQLSRKLFGLPPNKRLKV